ncbi:hypothetical protein GCM10023191_034750 [Actinoallomurus oryzae]|uniref:DUF4352 domain-containing protein n=1 Tax=Actinoallomurus oryzae TaxID=502180 RepID=A0ABP8PZ00_9ACTN
MISQAFDTPTRRANPLLVAFLILLGLAMAAVLVGVGWTAIHRWTAAPPTRPAGTTVTDGDLAFRVAYVDTTANSQGVAGETVPTGKFVNVRVSVTNRAGRPRHVDPADQFLRAGGKRYAVDHDATVNAGDTAALSLPGRTGATGSLILVFDVPKRVASAAIEVHATASSGGARVTLPAFG